MTPRISQASYGCQVDAVLTHRNLRTQLRNQWEEASADLWEGEEEGRKQAGIPFSHHPSASNVMEQQWHSPLLKTNVHGARKLCCCWGSVGDAEFRYYFFSFSFFHLDPFTFQQPETENTISARNHHLGESLYSRSSQLTLTLVSEIVLLLLQVTPKIAT